MTAESEGIQFAIFKLKAKEPLKKVELCNSKRATFIAD